jgi:hypothetical protein
MKTLTDHKVNGLNEALVVKSLDAAGQGGANHKYSIAISRDSGVPITAEQGAWLLDFQNGPVQEVGINGISNEALLTIVIDRLRGFQSNVYACRENAFALMKLEEGMMWLHKRTRDRLNRGVEGTNKV